jgi:flagellar hook-associated protein 2
MGVTVDGLVSGLDTTSIIEAYVSVYSAGTDRLRDQQSDLENRLALIQELNGYLESLQGFAEDYADADDLRLSTATSSSEAVMTVAAENGAQPGTYSVDVVALAQSEMEVSQGYASEDDVVATSGDIEITIAGETTTISVSEANGNNTLGSLVGAINDEVDGVNAYIMNDGGLNPYRLVIVSEETGAEQTVEITDTLAGGTAPGFNEAISAADAQITMAGIDIFSANNNFDDVVPGLNMDAIATGSVTVSVGLDTEGIVDTVQSFVDMYNDVANFIDDYTGMADEDDHASSLAGEAVLSTVQSGLQAVMSGLYQAGDLQGTSILGFATQQDGTLELDTSKLQDALTDHPEDTLNILAGEDGIFQTMEGRLDIVLDPDNGTMTLRQESLDDQIDALQEQIADSEASTAIYEDALRMQFTNLEIVMAQMQAMSGYLTQLFASSSS